MAKLIGTVRQVVGEAFVVGDDGVRRLLIEGDRVYAGERVITAGGAVDIDLVQGGGLAIGRGSELALTEQLLGDAQGPAVAAAPSAAELAEVEALQQAIAAGEDPTQAAPATAAGPAAGGAGGAGGGNSFVLTTRWGA
jgi:hypothetical protein